MGLFLSLLNSWLSNLRTKQTIRNIEKNNELRKNISRYQPSDIEAFIERDKQVGSYIISGINPSIRCRAAASVAACALSQNIPVIIIHEGNTLLQNHVIQATAFTKNKVVISNNTTIYDPFYNRSDQEICNLIINSAKSSGTINAVGQLYILGIIQFIKSKNIPPYCEMFIRCPHDSLFDKIDDAESNGYLKSNTATQIRDLLMQGQSERANVQSFLAQLAYQGIGVLSNKGNRNSVVNVKTAVSHNGLLMIDVGSSTNDILINVLINEVKELLACGNKMMLILDNIGLNSNDVLSKLLKSLSSRCLTTLLSEDIYSMLGGDEKLFHSF